VNTRFFYKQLHFWVEPRVTKQLMQLFEPQSCLLVAYYFRQKFLYIFVIFSLFWELWG